VQQLALFEGYYFCHNCQRTVSCVRKQRRWQLCNACWENIVIPTAFDYQDIPTDVIYAARNDYWAWVSKMEKRYPLPRNWGHTPTQVKDLSDAHYPFCACGNRRQPSIYNKHRDLFGGPFRRLCVICEAKAVVESVMKLATYQDRDDEDWLDLLYKTHRELFELGILPEYWFELKEASVSRQEIDNGKLSR